MDLLHNLILGFQVALTPFNILFCLIGALIGTLVGVLPGIGPVATLAILLPTTFYLPPVAALIMLSGIYYGAQYGGSTTAILVNLPGESSSLVTCIDGYAMAQRGRAGAALAVAALGSFFAGTVATLFIAIASPPLSQVALQFGPAEYFSLMVLGLIGAVVLASGSLTKAVTMVFLGLLLGLVGTDTNSGTQRFTFGMPVLSDGIGFVPIAMGLLGITEIITNLEQQRHTPVVMMKIGRLMPTREEFRRAWPAVLRGTGIGSLLGVLPGGGALLASFAAYAFEKKIAREPARFGSGAIEGVAAPESANNAGAQTSFIPLLTLGIPSNPTMAVMVGAMTIQGIAPRAARHGHAAGAVLGNHCQHVGRQPGAGDHQLAADRHLGAAAHRAVPAAVPGDPAAVLHRRLQPQQLADRSRSHRPIRVFRLRVLQTRLRAGAVRTRLHPGTPDGRKPAARAAAGARRSDDVRVLADQPRAADRCGGTARARGRAGVQAHPRGGVSRGVVPKRAGYAR